ncbi:MAG TPA: TonB family protein [Verrucomicrobiae bacterium]|jgi:TonB family protein|nr:TonB family protein [Verrucomicrobiae bacterium]
MNRSITLVLAFTLLGANAPATQPQTLDGIVLGSNIRDVVKLRGNPDVVNTDIGHVWTWHDAKTGEVLRATTGDDGAIQIVDVSAPDGDMRVVRATDGARAIAFGFGLGHMNQPGFPVGEPYSIARGTLPDSGDAAEFWRMGITPTQELILTYDTITMPDGPLREIFLGNTDALANAGLNPDKAADDDAYRAPLLDTIGSADYTGAKQSVVYTRIVINTDGTIAKSTIFISSGDEELDRVALAIANGCTFEPATVRGRPTIGIYFRRENFLINS